MIDEALEEKNKKRFRRASAILMGAAVLILAFFLILVLFRVRQVEVSGNHHITKEELEERILKGPVSGNSLFLRLFQHHPHLSDEPFVDQITVDYVDRHTVRITVKEKSLVGYVSCQGSYWYFDGEGKILVQSDQPERGDEALIASENDNPGADDGVEEVKDQSKMSEASSDDTDTDSSGKDGGEKSKAEEASSETSSDADETSPRESTLSLGLEDELTASKEGTQGSSDSTSGTLDPYYIPLVKGLSVTDLQVGEVMAVTNPSVFDVLKSITEIINKHGIDPDYVQFSGDGTLRLVVGTIVTQLGSDEHLEEKLEEMAAILPNAEGLSGILHLENFDGTQKRIIFDKSSS